MRARRWLPVMSAVWVGVLVAAATIWVLQRIAPTLWLFVAGLLVAYVLDPLLDRLEARGWSRIRAVVVVTVAIAVCIALVAAWLMPVLVGQAQTLAQHWPQYSAAIDRAYQGADTWLRAYLAQRFEGRDVMPYLDSQVAAARSWLEAKLPQFLRVLSDALLRSVSLIGLAAMVGFISFHFMLVIDPFRKSLHALLPGSASADVHDVSRQVGAMLGQYLRGQATMCLIMGALATCSLLILGRIFGTQYGLIIGLVAGAIYLVPWVGALLTNVTAVILGYVTAAHDPVLSALCAFGAMTLANLICDNVISPKVIGRSVGLHPLVVIFALLTGYQLLGLPGMIISAPAAASIKIILARWLPLAKTEDQPGRPAPIVFDLHAAIQMTLSGVRGVTRRIEDVVGIGAHYPEPSEHEGDTTDDDPTTA